jgi:hypothetical protein
LAFALQTVANTLVRGRRLSEPNASVDVLKSCEVCRVAKRFVRANRSLRKLVCPACYTRLYRRRYPCRRCGRIGLPAVRSRAGTICTTCYHREVAIDSCAKCLRRRPIYRRSPGGPLCEACADRLHRPQITCSICARTTFPKGAGPTGEPICGACYRRSNQPKMPCHVCSQIRIVAIRLSASGGICTKCYFDLTWRELCSRCQERKRLLRSEWGDVCLKCFRVGKLVLAHGPTHVSRGRDSASNAKRALSTSPLTSSPRRKGDDPQKTTDDDLRRLNEPDAPTLGALSGVNGDRGMSGQFAANIGGDR